ncbi:glutathione S-transferase [Curvibacter sp. CHRR-16]|uniref:glutathione S-transferase family protein n=1 Tax=Curvibacter sp. CHRR-16 TaxID=2835872 RepID=UPI001BD9368B|nr:glutathione S-transferase [Curvibacter sp. CHRR-16]MBT0569850.1 glutathione S-transferase [Curvibacter sp. CHRR-16]
MPHLWGRLTSINVRKVAWAVGELGLDLPRTDAGREFGVVNTSEYQALNPNALVPTLQDGDLVLWESNVIVRYLCARYGNLRGRDTGLYPQDLAQRFDAERWMDWQQTTFNPAGRGAFMQLIRTPLEQRQSAVIAQSQEQTYALLAQLDAHLQERLYLCGERFTMADIPLGCEMHRWYGLPLEHPRFAAVEAWFDRLRQRPAAHAILTMPLG